MGIYRTTHHGLLVYGNNSARWASNKVLTLSDGSDSTYIDLKEAALFTVGGYIEAFPKPPDGTEWPSGRSVVAMRVAHRFTQPSTSFRGWPVSYLRSGNGGTIAGSTLKQMDGYRQDVVRTQYGQWLYAPGGGPWQLEQLTDLVLRHQLVSDPDVSTNRNVRVVESWLEILWSEPLATPAAPAPASGATIDTSNPELSYQLRAPQDGQLVRAVIEVARNNSFTTDKRTLVTDYGRDTTTTARVRFTGAAELGPGTWYMRAKGQDITGTDTGWSAVTAFTVAHAALPPPAPSVPAPGAIVVDPLAARAARITTAASDGRKVGVQFEFSTSADFAAHRVTHTVPVDAGASTGLVSYTPAGDGQRLRQGTQFMRVRAVDKWGQTSAWSAAQEFTVQHRPVAQNVSPAANRVIDPNVTPVRWTFGDPWTGDAQSAYQVRVATESGEVVYDSGKVISQSLQQLMSVPAGQLFQRLRLTVSLWDIDDVTSPDPASYYFISSSSPRITMSFPAANEVIATGQPTFRWEPGIERPQAQQKSFEIKVYNSDTGRLIHTSGVVASATARSYTPPQTILSNGGSYQLTLRIVDTDELTSTLTRNFSASYQAPESTTVQVAPQSYLENGFVQLDWGLSRPDPYFINWKVYRRKVGDVDWDLIATIDDSSVTRYRDWLVPEVAEYQYTVTQIADRFGYILESALDDDAPPYYLRSEDFWLIDELDETNNIRLYSVSDNPYTVSYERNDYVVKGRGRRTNFGTRLGVEGTMTCKVRPRSGFTPTQLIRKLEALQALRYSVLLRDPFGRITRITLGDISVTPLAGTGPDEFADVSIPYTEVY